MPSSPAQTPPIDGAQHPAPAVGDTSQLASVLASLPDAVLCLNGRWQITYANMQAQAVSHVTAADLNGPTLWELFPGLIGLEVEHTLRRVAATRVPGQVDFYHSALKHWVTAHILPIDESGLAIHYRDITESRESAARIDASTKHLQQVLEAAPDSILILDRDWNFTFANQQAIDLLRSGPLVGENLWQLFPGNHDEPYNSSYRRTMSERIPTEFEAFYGAPLDTWFRVSARPYGTDCIILFFSDITARKLAEQARDRTAAQLQQVFDITTDAIVSLDRNYTLTFLNRRAHELLSPAGDVLGKNLFESFPGAVYEGSPYLETYRRAMDQRIPGEFEAFYPAPLNLWLRVEARPAPDGIIVFFRDITADRIAHAALRASESRYRALTELNPQLIFTSDSKGRVTFANQRLKDFLGTETPGAEQPSGWGAALHPDDRAGVTSVWLKSIHTGDPFSAHARVRRHSDGHFRWLDIHGLPIRSDSGEVQSWLGVASDIHEQKIASEAIAASEARYRILTELGPQLIYTADATGTPNFANQRLLDYMGVTLEQLKLDGGAAACHPQDRPIVFGNWRHSLETGEPYSAEFRLRRASDGQFRWFLARSLPIRNADGEVEYWLGVSTDIHDQKIAAEAAAASEARYRTLTDLNPQFIWMGSPEGKITYANQRFVEYVGRRPGPQGSQDWPRFFDPEDRQRLLDSWQHSVSTGDDLDTDARLLRESDGASRWFHLRASPVRDDSGAILHWLGVAIDIHESRTFAETLRLKQLETERRRAELETVYKTAPIGLALFDPVEFRYLNLNDRQAEIIGLPKEQILGRGLTEIAPIPGLHEMFEQVAAGNPIVNQTLEGELPMQPGIHRYWTVNYFPVYGRDGSIEAISAASLEITQQKKAEDALIQSEKLAAVGRLASSISHEINNPLEAITNLLYLISLGNNLPEDARVYLQMAQAEVARVSQIATQTLRFHRQAVRPTAVTPAQLVDAVLDLYQGRLANSGIRVEASYATATPIICFENDIRQVLNNLIANAIDAMRTGGRLLTRAHDAVHPRTGQRGVRVTVADTGHGMSPAVLSRIFEPFYTTKDLNGTGLGLWISRGIVDRHGGHLSVRSTEHPVHHGTIFSLFLPLQEPSAPDEQPAS